MEEISMYRALAAAAALGLGATFACGQNLGVIKERRQAMRAIAISGTINLKMFKGEIAFDLAKLQGGLKTYQEEAAKLKALFPEDSKTGGDTDASPRIWRAKTDFDKAIDTFIAVAKTAASAITDQRSFKAQYAKVVRSCDGCHKDANGFAPRLIDSFKKLNR
jgi:cytochrome c556